MKLCLNYNVFEGIELLQYSINQIRNYVDFILVTYQENSYYGKPIKPEDYDELKKLEKEKIIDRLLLFRVEKFAEVPYQAKLIETEKRNFSKKWILSQGFTHELHLDGDEFFRKEEFERAKNYFIKKKLEFSAVYFKDYFNYPVFRCKNFSKNIIPFISIVDKRDLCGALMFNHRVDPTRAYKIEVWEFSELFNPEMIFMHHMTGIRRDLLFKYASTSRARMDRSRISEIVNTIKSVAPGKFNYDPMNIIECPDFEMTDNFFNLPF